MKKVLLLGALVLILAGAVSAQWVYGPSSASLFTLWRIGGEYYPPTGKIYILGGRLQDLTTTGEIYSFDPVSLTFADEILAMEIPISNYSVALLNDPTGPDSLALYTVGGRDAGGTMTAALQVFYPISGLAMSLTSDPYPGKLDGYVHFPAQGTAVVNNKLYVFGGYVPNPPKTTPPYNADSTYVYDPALPAGSRWSNITTARLSQRRGYITSAVVDGKIYAIGGNWTPNGGVPLYNSKVVERFDPANPAAGWVRMADAPDTTCESKAFGFNTGSPYALAGHIIVTPRGCWPDPFTTCYDYNVATNTWTTFTDVNMGRRDQAGAFVPDSTGGTMWLFDGRKNTGGMGDSATATTEYYRVLLGVAEQQGGVKLVKKTELLQPAPNPFMGKTLLRYSLMQSGPVSLVIYGITGQRVRTLVSGNRAAGTNEVVWDGRNDVGEHVRAGVYFARFAAEKVHSTERITVLR
jgi:hypothetical protein